MNEHFVNIKVDREERPDVDHIYMNAVQMLTGRGGWPMTVFLTPDGQAVLRRHLLPAAGPPRPAGVPPRAARHRAGVSRQARRGAENRRTTDGRACGTAKPPSPRPNQSTPAWSPTPPPACRAPTTSSNGGIGQAPKFPNEAVCDLFLRVARGSGQQRYLDMALHTLRQMARGGIYDQLGGGFHRYSVDEHWLVPHFEKMLYDNAQLVPLYLSAYQITGDAFFARIARETLDYVIREMRSPGMAASTRPRTPTAKARKASSSCGTSPRCSAFSAPTRRSWPAATGTSPTSATSKAATSCTSRSTWSSSPSCSAATCSEVEPILSDSRARLFAAREQRVKPDARREDADGVERLDDQRLRQGRGGARRAALPPGRRRCRRLHRSTAAARRPPAQHLQGRRRQAQRLPRRLRVLHRRAARRLRADAGTPLSRARRRPCRRDAARTSGTHHPPASTSPATITRR